MVCRLLGVLTLAVLLPGAARAGQQPLLMLRAPGAQIGATFRDASTEPGARRDRGAVVADVQANSPAGASGLRAGDLVTVFDGVDVRDARDLNRLVAETPPGRVVSITIIREGRARMFKVAPVPGR